MDRRPPLDVFTACHATTATTLPATWDAVTVEVIWDGYRTDVEESEAVENYDADRASFRRDQVTDIQAGETFTAPRNPGALPTTFRVLRVYRRDPDYFHVAVA